jgi:hypothetical protein
MGFGVNDDWTEPADPASSGRLGIESGNKRSAAGATPHQNEIQ